MLRHRRFRPYMGSLNIPELELLGKAVADGTLDVAIARTVPLAEAIPALTELEEQGTPKGGKLVIIP
jgi:NADPH:quinone reductase-like Zn-dependent oxidoreductase